MEVKCINDNRSTQLFVGEIYNCTFYNNYGIRIKGLNGSFLKELFTLSNGDRIPDGDWRGKYEYDGYLRREDLVENLVIVCTNENLKTLTYKKIYHIDKIDPLRRTISVKENSDGRKYSIWNFKKVPVDQLRSLELENLLEEGDSIKKLTSDYDSYNHIEESEMIEIMSRAILDAITYKNKTDSKVSLFDIMKRRRLKSSLYTIEDFKSLSKVNWEVFLTK